MRRFFLLIILVCFGLSVFANQNEYPAITPENVMNLQEVETIGQGALYGSLAWSPDGSRIVTGGAQGIFIFDTNYQNIDFIAMGKPVTILQFAPDGSFVFAIFDGKINAFDLETRIVRYQLDSSSILATSENGQLVAYPKNRLIQIADVATGELRYVLDYIPTWMPDYNDGYGYRISSFVFAQFINSDEQILIRWATQEGQGEFPFGAYFAQSDIWTLAIATFETVKDDTNAQRSEDEFLAYDNNDNMFRLNESYWHRDNLSIALFPPDISLRLKTDDYRYWLEGNLFAAPIGTHSESEDYWGVDASQTGIWNIQTGELLTIIPKLGRVVFSPDQTKIAINNEIFDISSGEPLAILQNDTYRVLSGVDDRILKYGADDSLRLLDAVTLEEIAILPLKRSELAEIRDIFSDDSLLFGNQNQRQYIRISIITGSEIARYESDIISVPLELSPDGQYLIADYWRNSMYHLEAIWDANSGEKVELPPNFDPLMVDFSVQQVIGWDAQTIIFYDLLRAETRQEISLAGTDFGNRGTPTSIKLSSNGEYLALSFNSDGLVLRVATSELITSFWMTADFNPSSTYLIYCDSTWRIWRMNLADNSQEELILGSDIPMSINFNFRTDEIVSIYLGGPDGAGETRTYNIFTMQEIANYAPTQQTQPENPQPFAESNGIRFYIDNGVRIEWNEQPISLRLNPVNFSSAALSSDSTRLYINYTDGTIGIWAVRE